jgi:hypothetical protein
MNLKKIFLSIVSILLSWMAVDFVVHGILLKGFYQDTAQFWRPLEEMSQSSHLLGTLIAASVFVMFYQKMISQKSLLQGLRFGCFYGTVTGLGAAYFCIYMPIPIELGLAWFACNFTESCIAGCIAGCFLKNESDLA